MERERLVESYPHLTSLLDEELDELRYFVVVDPNVEEEADEADVFDPTEYNWIVYLPERIKEALGEEKFAQIYERLEALELVEDLMMDEEDLFGIRSAEEDEEKVAAEVMAALEGLARELKEESA
jgi:predicted oxidoreductase